MIIIDHLHTCFLFVHRTLFRSSLSSLVSCCFYNSINPWMQIGGLCSCLSLRHLHSLVLAFSVLRSYMFLLSRLQPFARFHSFTPTFAFQLVCYLYMWQNGNHMHHCFSSLIVFFQLEPSILCVCSLCGTPSHTLHVWSFDASWAMLLAHFDCGFSDSVFHSLDFTLGTATNQFLSLSSCSHFLAYLRSSDSTSAISQWGVFIPFLVVGVFFIARLLFCWKARQSGKVDDDALEYGERYNCVH